ncbi:hypothetical protein [Nodularia sp. NIES-3585]|uniref:hypothetical protein n=1 Tax=Nodularia sp. NIES-3585 TaxID=1973477 RepID=UPI000B5CC49C|nr:hypothetical protein [Nodularia sp. NIES-3585]GAX34901.1 hypothetical protein NIES3585_09060 [Nodularia sp. NIES-3585]
MKKYNQLADLESLLLDIADSSIRAYAKEAIDCYFAGAYRASIVSIWIAVVFDLYQKIRYLSEQYLYEILLKVKELWDNASDSLKQRFKTYIKDELFHSPGQFLAVSIFFDFNETEDIISDYTKLELRDQKLFFQQAVKLGVLNLASDSTQKIIEINIDTFTKSSSFASARLNSDNLIEPARNLFSEQLIFYLLNKSVENQRHERNYNQLDNCENIFIEIFNSTIDKYPNTLEKWQWFIETEEKLYWHDLREKIALKANQT